MIFQLIQKNLSILGVSRTQSARMFRIKILIGCLLLGIHTVIHLKFLFDGANTFQQYVECIFVSSITVTSLWCYTSLIYKSKELLEFLDDIEKLLNRFKETLNDEYPKTATEIFNAVHLVEECSRIIYLVAVKVTPVCCLLPKSCYCFYCYYANDLGRDSFELSDRTVWFPFDIKNPIGYSLAFVLQSTMMTYTLFLAANIVSIWFGSYLLGITVTKEIKRMLYIADKRLRLKKQRSLAMKRFKELIKWHSFIKQIINDFSNLFQSFFMAAFIWSTQAICLLFIMIQLEKNENNLAIFIIIFFTTSYTLGLVFIVCEMCQQVSDGFEGMNEVMNQFYWPAYPIKLQRSLPIVIIFMQQPVEFKVFGSIACSRDSLKKIINRSFSYFMVIREFF